MRLSRYFATLTALLPVLILWQHMQPRAENRHRAVANEGCSLLRRSEACQREAESGLAWVAGQLPVNPSRTETYGHEEWVQHQLVPPPQGCLFYSSGVSTDYSFDADVVRRHGSYGCSIARLWLV